MKKTIAILAGDGIGPEVMPQAIRVLNKIAEKFQHQFNYHESEIGGAAFEKYGEHFPASTKNICQAADAILFGSVGGPIHEANLKKWQDCEKNSILALRKTLNLNVNIRPFQIYPQLIDISPIRDKLTTTNTNFIVLRELTGDIYFGEHKQWNENGKRFASDVAVYNEEQISNIAHRAFQFAQQRKKKVTSVDKANVLDTSKLWRQVVTEIAREYPDVKLEHMLVDNCAMQLFINPAQFDVILTSNLFGDILSDAAAALPGSLGLIPSASLNKGGLGLYEPSGGSAPDIAGKNIANPIAQILSAAMMLRYSFAMHDEALSIETAIQNALNAGNRTADIHSQDYILVNTKTMTDAILSFL